MLVPIVNTLFATLFLYNAAAASLNHACLTTTPSSSIPLGECNLSGPCRFLPGDACWPGIKEWNQLNDTVNGRLIATIPVGHVCHDPTYNAEACAMLNQTWGFPIAHINDPSGFMSAYHQNASCDPFVPQSSLCQQGNYVSYAINVREIDDVVAGIRFARENNVRLVIKNTGHDYLGKSTGKGGLSLWTHNLKSMEIFNYSSAAYTGPAIKMGAGIQGFEVYEAASAIGLQVVGGSCPSVGIVGGYTQGGGHSLLSSKYGLAADQTLEWEVVTADGKLLTATPTENSDLYWALSGGGGGTYGVVMSMTVKAYPDGVVGGASLQVVSPVDTLLDVVAFLHTSLPGLVDAGAHVTWSVLSAGFAIPVLTVPDASASEVRDLLTPFTTLLKENKIPYTLNITEFPKYIDHLNHYLGPLPYGPIPSAQIQGGVIFSRDTIADPTSNSAILTSIRDIITTTNFMFVSSALNVSVSVDPHPPNAVLPAWRSALMYPVIAQIWNYTIPFAEMAEQERILTEEVMPPLQEYASGAYLNEADFNNPRWKEDYYGNNYVQLKEVKRKWDPESLFYAKTGVGSEEWGVNEEGRLCRVCEPGGGV